MDSKEATHPRVYHSTPFGEDCFKKVVDNGTYSLGSCLASSFRSFETGHHIVPILPQETQHTLLAKVLRPLLKVPFTSARTVK